jgi:hypothetical protein
VPKADFYVKTILTGYKIVWYWAHNLSY